MFKKFLPLILILILAAALRLVLLDRFPVGMNADEAALGYNAYSLLLTGKDEHGHFLPVNLESFGDYKPALYTYLLVPAVKFFGLTDMVVRLPSALFGLLAVAVIYFFSLQLTSNRTLALLSALFLAVSPWHLHFSRGAWEVNVATALILVGMTAFLRWLNRPRPVYLFTLLLTFALSMYTYQSARIIAPLLGLGLVALFFSVFFSRLKQSLTGFVLLLLLLLPLVLSLVFSDAASRVGGVGLLADEGPVNFVRELRGQHSAATLFIGKLLHNRPVIYSLQFVKNYLSHFDGNFLFVNGDVIQRNLVPETGLLYLTDLVLLFFGLIYFTRPGQSPRRRIVWLWVLVAPVASALTFQVPHALRAQNLIIPLSVIAAAGICRLYQLSAKRVWVYGLTAVLVLTYSWQFTRYLHQYYVHYPQTYPAAWESGFDRLVAYVKANQARYQHILVTDKYDQPYILFLYYLQYPPAEFQGQHQLTVRDKYNFSTVTEFSKYRFTSTAWEQVRDQHDSLLVTAPDDLPSVGVNIVNTIYFPNGQPAFRIVSN
jgi:4-amino-4-deoxy-L-arabinose transferase-like glycosyltransferase